MIKRSLITVSLLVTAACSSGSGGGGAGAVNCKQESDADDSDDCKKTGKPRQLECSDDAGFQSAIAAGCSSAGDKKNVCCPISVSGVPEKSTTTGAGTSTTPSGYAACYAKIFSKVALECSSTACPSPLYCDYPSYDEPNSKPRCASQGCSSDSECQTKYASACTNVKFACQPYITSSNMRCQLVESSTSTSTPPSSDPTPSPSTVQTGPENTISACTDDGDNDGNGYIDCGERACCGVIDCSSEPSSYCAKIENTFGKCSDGFDNDGDGYGDCEDKDCCAVRDCSSKPTSYCATQ